MLQFQEKWNFYDSSPSGIPAGIPGGTEAWQKWCVWLPNSTFGKVIDFSTEGSFVKANASQANLMGDFTLSAFIMAPPRENQDRTILTIGKSFRWCLAAEENFALAIDAPGVTGLEACRASLADGRWHHVVTSRRGNTITYYIDGAAVKTCSVRGSFVQGESCITIGADYFGRRGLDGSVAEVAILEGAYTPDQLTQTRLDPSDNEKKATRLPLKRGVVIDRPQYFSNLIPLSYTMKSDIINCMNMGFDHVKLQLTPEWMIDENGGLVRENMAYICSVLDMVVELDYQGLLCISPCAAGIDYNFKTKYLGDLGEFEKLVHWYGQLGTFLREKSYSPDNIAIQIMTEPYDNTPVVSWSWMSDRLWGALRNALPEHTIVTSADRSGNLEHVKKMSPASDTNLIYSFTTYEPYTIGWSSGWTSQVERHTFWNYLHEIPWPIEPGVDYTAAIENTIRDVPLQWKALAREKLALYAAGILDGGDPEWPNYYPGTVYDRQWNFRRMKSLDDWRQKYGGNIHIMCVEFGCYDSQHSMVRFGSSTPGTPDSLRQEFINNLRQAMEAYDIGWSYWDYNEGFTLFDTTYHMENVTGSPSVEQAKTLADYPLLTDALGLTPHFAPLHPGLQGARGAWSEDLSSALPGMKDGILLEQGAMVEQPFLRMGSQFTLSAHIKTQDPGTILAGGQLPSSRLQLHTFDELHKVWGSDIHVDEDCVEGTGCFCASAKGPGDVTFCWWQANLDLSDYLAPGQEGTLHLSVYVDDPSAITGGQLQLSSHITAHDDSNILSWDLGLYPWKKGWNDVFLPRHAALRCTTDVTQINSARVFFNLRSSATVKLDDFYVSCEDRPGGPEYWKLFVDSHGCLSFCGQGMSGISSSGKPICDGQWHHVVVSCGKGALTYYVDGQAVRVCVVTGAVKNPASAALFIGTDSQKENSLPGRISQPAIYCKTLPPEKTWTK